MKDTLDDRDGVMEASETLGTAAGDTSNVTELWTTSHHAIPHVAKKKL